MTAVALERETAAEHIRNAIQILMVDRAVDDVDLASVRDRLYRALEELDELQAKYDVAVELLRYGERERKGLVQESKDTLEFLGDLEDLGLHIKVDWRTGTYRVQRDYRRVILDTPHWADVQQLVKEVRALEQVLNSPRAVVQ